MRTASPPINEPAGVDFLLRYVVSNVPRYRQFRGAELADFPLLTKVALRADYESYLTTALSVETRAELLKEGARANCAPPSGEKEISCHRFLFEHSSGTTGPAVWYPRSKVERCELAFAVAKFRSQFCSYSPKAFADINELWNRGELPATISQEAAAEAFAGLARKGYRHLYGTLSLLGGFAEVLSQHGTTVPFAVVESAGEFLDDIRSSHLRRAFGGRLLNQYGCRETWAIGYSDNGSSLFEILPEVIVELVDESGNVISEYGRAGLIVVTSLVLRTMPIIRFVTGDFGQWEMHDGQKKLRLEEERLSSKVRWYPGAAPVSGIQLMKRIFTSIVTDSGGQVLGHWKVRKETKGYEIFLERADLGCREAIQKEFQAHAALLGDAPINFVIWNGWAPQEKQVLFVDRTVTSGQDQRQRFC